MIFPLAGLAMQIFLGAAIVPGDVLFVAGDPDSSSLKRIPH
jgi:hypothetical protein